MKGRGVGGGVGVGVVEAEAAGVVAAEAAEVARHAPASRPMYMYGRIEWPTCSVFRSTTT